MSNWSSFEKDKIATDAWRSYLNERYTDEIRGAIGLPPGWESEEQKEQREKAQEIKSAGVYEKLATSFQEGGQLKDVVPEDATEPKSLIDIIKHGVLDLAGLDFMWFWTTPVVAPFIAGAFDIIHAWIYAKEKKWFLSALSLACGVGGAADVALKGFKYLFELKTGVGVLKVVNMAMAGAGTWSDIRAFVEKEGIHDKDAHFLVTLDEILSNPKVQPLLNYFKEKDLFGVGAELVDYIAEMHQFVEDLERAKGWPPYPWNQEQAEKPATEDEIRTLQRHYAARNLEESEIKRWQTIAGIKKRVA